MALEVFGEQTRGVLATTMCITLYKGEGRHSRRQNQTEKRERREKRNDRLGTIHGQQMKAPGTELFCWSNMDAYPSLSGCRWFHVYLPTGYE